MKGAKHAAKAAPTTLLTLLDSGYDANAKAPSLDGGGYFQWSTVNDYMADHIAAHKALVLAKLYGTNPLKTADPF